MPQVAALNALVNQAPFNQLIGGVYTTIWIRSGGESYTASGRRKSDGAVVPLPGVAGAVLVSELDAILRGTQSVDVEVNGAAYGFTRIGTVGSIEYAVTEHALIPQSVRGTPTVVI
ncbi:hypothetical protein [Paraburkholderia humisilvae]|uniref:Uncharacterized protein n=1 Tax=Paraburkholderia humisilvae TaxID=627669 RepID=A0A6J5DMQ1_9BURK|nr:hypothetical protein [Paraburkholderia humisilvae]CAB3754096.1 hypothetical protein LMG29542_02247 [Paraburkholderia humisilvae]